MSGDQSLADELAAYHSLMEAAEVIPPDGRMTNEVVPGWTAHDVLWHVAYWVGRASEVLAAARSGPPFPDEPEEGSYYDKQNDLALSQGRQMSWEEILDHFERSRDHARTAMSDRAQAAAAWMEERFDEEIEHYGVHEAHLRAAVDGGQA